MPRIALLMTGSEIMAGDIVDSNAPYIAQALQTLGLHVDEKVSVGDKISSLSQSITRLANDNQLLFINGGLGPTEDDLTCAALSRVTGHPLAEHSEGKKHIEQWCQQRHVTFTQQQLKQAMLPTDATIFVDSPGSACGFYCTIKGCLVIATPGVPSELKSILQQSILPLLASRFKIKQSRQWQHFQLFGLGESRIENIIHQYSPNLQDYYEVGFRAQMSQVELKLRRLPQSPEENQEALQVLEKEAQKVKRLALDALSEYIFTQGSGSLAQELSFILKKNQLRLGLAESCTGGLIAKEITALAGASSFFQGGIVAYSNDIKSSLLAVSDSTLETQGAVSEACAREMLLGCLAHCHCDVGISVTGVAGPSGGSAEKPAGTVFIAYGSKSTQHCLALCIPFERNAFQSLVCSIALDSLRRFIAGLPINQGLAHRFAKS